MKKIYVALLALSTRLLVAEDYPSQANDPVYPVTCNGDWVLSFSGFYWTAHQDGMEYAIKNFVHVPVVNPTPEEIQELNNIVDDDIETPDAKWEFGFKLGLGYNTTCDGWDIGATWTRYHPTKASSSSADVSDNMSLITLWSAFAPIQGEVNFARDIDVLWKVELDLVDAELGRAYWVSHRMHLRPFIGFRYVRLNQNFELVHMGGSWSPRTNPKQDALQNEVDLQNDYWGFGLRAGLEEIYHLGCGWNLYGNFAASISYGRFNVHHDEKNRQAVQPYSVSKVMEAEDSFRASRAMLDFAFGVEWAGQFCDCAYGLNVRFGWEQHLFFNQNQMWRIVRIGDVATTDSVNLTGENTYSQRRGTLDTQGFTLTIAFMF